MSGIGTALRLQTSPTLDRERLATEMGPRLGDDVARRRDVVGVLQEPFGADLDVCVPGLAGCPHVAVGGRRHDRGPVQVDRRYLATARADPHDALTCRG